MHTILPRTTADIINYLIKFTLLQRYCTIYLIFYLQLIKTKLFIVLLAYFISQDKLLPLRRDFQAQPFDILSKQTLSMGCINNILSLPNVRERPYPIFPQVL